MNMLNALSVVARLRLALGTALAMLVGCAALAVWQQQQANAALEALVQHDLDKIRLVDRWAAMSENTSVRLMALNKSGDKAIGELFGPDIGPRIKAVGELFEKISAMADTQPEKDWLAALAPKRKALLQAVADVDEYKKVGDQPAASAMFDSAFMPAQKAYNDHVLQYAELQHKLLDDQVAQQERSGQRRSVVLTSIVAALGLLSAWLAWDVMRHIQRSLDGAVAVARQVAAGDLSVRARADGRDEFSALMRSLGEMAGSLERIVGQVRQGTGSIATASTQIAQGNNDLSQRTEQQAGNLQQAASAMEEITRSVQQSADNARQANTLVQEASLVAQRGGEAVSRVVETMGQIESASRRIEEIISVIDGISFQTNILALNAAVEAARAGEQGRGFAVVAGEVRTLAQRSAQAAKEIKQLIADSSDKVRNGSQQVEGAGRTMDEIVQSVQRVSTLVSEISGATGRQNDGIAEVGRSVGEIDRMTQQNAALVEQAAAAADSMRQQAVKLEDAVSVFRLSGQPA